MSFGIFIFLSGALNIGDVRPGDCLTLTQIQEITGASDASIYTAGLCGDEHELSGSVFQELSCGSQMPAGQWSRVVTEHKKPGFFWPRPVPCATTVTQLQKELTLWELKDLETTTCLDEDFFIATYQTESLQTQEFKAGQGKLYLPSPLLIHRETYAWTAESGNQMIACSQTSLVGNYLGLTSVELTFRENECPSGLEQSCTSLLVSEGTNAAGEACAHIEEVKNCSH